MASQVANQDFYAPGYKDPVRPANPYVPTELVSTTTKPSLPIVGVLALVVVIAVFEWMRRKRKR